MNGIEATSCKYCQSDEAPIRWNRVSLRVCRDSEFAGIIVSALAIIYVGHAVQTIRLRRTQGQLQKLQEKLTLYKK
jgi:hypothetical protein